MVSVKVCPSQIVLALGTVITEFGTIVIVLVAVVILAHSEKEVTFRVNTILPEAPTVGTIIGVMEFSVPDWIIAGPVSDQ